MNLDVFSWALQIGAVFGDSYTESGPFDDRPRGRNSGPMQTKRACGESEALTMSAHCHDVLPGGNIRKPMQTFMR